MAVPPDFIDIPSPPKFEDSSRREVSSPRGIGSPRFEHVEGEIPPELSPLDAFAAQGRLLAKQLEGSFQNGRRVSRLPPLSIANSLTQTRPSYFRAISTGVERPVDDGSVQQPEEAVPHTKTQLQVPDKRPVSHYPRLSAVSSVSGQSELPSTIPLSDNYDSQRPDSEILGTGEIYSSPRTSLSKIDPPGSDIGSVTHASEPQVARQASLDVAHRYRLGPRDPSYDVPVTPRSNAPSPLPTIGLGGMSIRSVPPETPEDEQVASLDGSLFSLPRKLSSGSAFSASTPPRSPFLPPPPPPRSPSISSERSFGGARIARGRTNFSRPLSRAGRPSLDIPSRQPSSDSQPSVFIDENVVTPVSLTSEEFFDASETGQIQGPASTYVYSRFALPRGRLLHHQSPNQSEQESSGWQQPLARDDDTTKRSVDSDQRPIHLATSPQETSFGLGARRESSDRLEKTQSRSLKVVTAGDRPTDQGATIPQPEHPPGPRPLYQSRPTMTTTTSQITIKSSKQTDSREISAEEHLTKGIELHERGSLNESTYHLRIAAKANLPTAMLLYALACRHGWGMRPNPREGVQWLRKAADLVRLEVADEEKRSDGSPTDFIEMKTRRAQFALSIYELGVSHMNGWGTEQDKGLALRCFEIAGGWGDADALVEAGFCYAEGIGCKKDLKKSARFYRMAESKGVSMVGNSWIHKSKYLDEPDDRQERSSAKDSSEKKPRDKSRTRTIFARKKSIVS
ncbi:MAG: hypothetical protein M1816_006101 [Peltula sp. TS41687]|nr:MAG: hypothetical protein M1816_006101 [Peltula sp. TS41687]